MTTRHFLPTLHLCDVGCEAASMKALQTMFLQAMNKCERRETGLLIRGGGLTAALIRNEFFPRREAPPENSSGFLKGYLRS
jgi:hypothetical protein